MKGLSSFRIGVIAAGLAVVLASPGLSQAQRRGGGGAPPVIAVAPDEADFHTYDMTKDPAKKSQLGEDFVTRYPSSQYSEVVYDQLIKTYYEQGNWTPFYADADKAIEKRPDDFNILTLVGWVIPHQYNPDDPDAMKKLDKASMYEMHAIDVLTNMVKPPTVTDDQFATAKTQLLSQAHSGLGLVYFRRQDYENSVKELQQATGGTSPDPTDIYALGISLEQLNRYGEAADAFQKCGASANPLQDRCKQSADKDKAKAAASPK
jgi:tetratricopeptide (TPR) repeat protein